jgi:hypothetical protein
MPNSSAIRRPLRIITRWRVSSSPLYRPGTRAGFASRPASGSDRPMQATVQPMSALDHQRTFRRSTAMFALTPKSGHRTARTACSLCANSGIQEFGSHQKKNPGTLLGVSLRLVASRRWRILRSDIDVDHSCLCSKCLGGRIDRNYNWSGFG